MIRARLVYFKGDVKILLEMRSPPVKGELEGV